MLEIILREIISDTRKTPHHMLNGARLDWSAARMQITITRLNRAPDGREIGIFINYIKRAGWQVVSRAPAEIEPGINSWLGVTLTLAPATKSAPPPTVEQGSLMATINAARDEGLKAIGMA